MDTNTIMETVYAGVVGTAIIGGFVGLRRWLVKELRIQKAAVFRLLKSNRTQGQALVAIASCQREGKCNGVTDEAITAVTKDQDSIAEWVRKAAMGVVPEDEEEEGP